jgi:hypothetical protein
LISEGQCLKECLFQTRVDQYSISFTVTKLKLKYIIYSNNPNGLCYIISEVEDEKAAFRQFELTMKEKITAGQQTTGPVLGKCVDKMASVIENGIGERNNQFFCCSISHGSFDIFSFGVFIKSEMKFLYITRLRLADRRARSALRFAGGINAPGV